MKIDRIAVEYSRVQCSERYTNRRISLRGVYQYSIGVILTFDPSNPETLCSIV